MSVGKSVRRLLGSSLSRRIGGWYRALFVDLDKEAEALAAVIPHGAHVLDIGGGDGEPINHLLAIRPDLRVTTLDPAPVVGQWIEARFAARVTRLPGTSLADFVASGRSDPNVILLADVMHHIPEVARPDFLSSVRVLLDRVAGLRIIVKDVEPDHFRSLLGLWSDRYVTGDRNVKLVSRASLDDLLQQSLGPLQRVETRLFETDRPNYAVAFFR
jgi:hypothetical protein